MSILNKASDGLTGIYLILWKFLRLYGPTEKTELLNQCMPLALDEYKVCDSNQDQLRRTLTRGIQLGVFSEAEDVIALRQPFDEIAVDDIEFWPFRLALLRVVLAEGNNHDLLRKEPKGSADFTYVASWLLAQDIYSLPGGGHTAIEELHNKQFLEPKVHGPLQNDTRWPGFKEWGPFLGLSWTYYAGNHTVLHIDPSDAVRAFLPEVFGAEEELPQALFLERLAQLLPVIDGGSYRVRAEERIDAHWRPLAQHEISPSLSRALVRLRIEGALQLQRRSDADQRVLLGRGFEALEGVTHFKIGVRNA